MDTLDSSKLRVALAWVAIRDTLPFTDYKLLAEWLDCYEYILPAARQLSPFIAGRLTDNLKVLGIKRTSRDLFTAWLLADLIESTLTLKEQGRLHVWMNGSNYSRIPA